jgi:DNA repair protein RecN (Recombination protein N)
VLLQLRIKNFAIIDDCLLTFDPGLVALTGETGAGKSIIVDALSACIGSRVGPETVRHGADSALVEAIFGVESMTDELAAFTAGHDLTLEDGMLILAREILRTGRSTSRVNGRAVLVSVLAGLGDHLVDLHGQSEHLSILKPLRQLDMLDHFARLDGARAHFAVAAKSLIEARVSLVELRSGQRAAQQRLDLLRFQVEEIEAASLSAGEEERLREEKTRLANAEKLAALANSAIEALTGTENGGGAVELLGESAKLLSQLLAIDSSVEGSLEAADGLRFQAEDLAGALRSYRDAIEFDPMRLDEIESRLDDINRLRRKYGSTTKDVLEFLESARSELQAIEDYDERLIQIEADVAVAETSAATLAQELSERRSAAAGEFTSEVRDRLGRLGLGPAGFEIRLEQSASEDGLQVDSGSSVGGRLAFTFRGVDTARFLVSFNSGEPLSPIERVASGGETARFMLAVKSVLAAADDVPTLIFDEIDTGVGGRSGRVVGEMLRELSRSHQVISITHLAQIAALSDEHLKVVKRQEDKGSEVVVERLDREGRVRELAEMLAGAPPGRAAVQSAEDMLIRAARD